MSAMIALAGSCSMYQRIESRNAKTESLLADAGFTKIPIETPAQHRAVDDLPLLKLNRYQSGSGTVFWYADPDRCRCLYEGDQKAYDRYAMLLQQQDDTAAYARESDPEELAPLGTFGYWFPPPAGSGTWLIFASTGAYSGTGYNHGSSIGAGASGFGMRMGGWGFSRR